MAGKTSGAARCGTTGCASPRLLAAPATLRHTWAALMRRPRTPTNKAGSCDRGPKGCAAAPATAAGPPVRAGPPTGTLRRLPPLPEHMHQGRNASPPPSPGPAHWAGHPARPVHSRASRRCRAARSALRRALLARGCWKFRLRRPPVAPPHPPARPWASAARPWAGERLHRVALTPVLPRQPVKKPRQHDRPKAMLALLPPGGATGPRCGGCAAAARHTAARQGACPRANKRCSPWAYKATVRVRGVFPAPHAAGRRQPRRHLQVLQKLPVPPAQAGPMRALWPSLRGGQALPPMPPRSRPRAALACSAMCDKKSVPMVASKRSGSGEPSTSRPKAGVWLSSGLRARSAVPGIAPRQAGQPGGGLKAQIWARKTAWSARRQRLSHRHSPPR